MIECTEKITFNVLVSLLITKCVVMTEFMIQIISRNTLNIRSLLVQILLFSAPLINFWWESPHFFPLTFFIILRKRGSPGYRLEGGPSVSWRVILPPPAKQNYSVCCYLVSIHRALCGAHRLIEVKFLLSYQLKWFGDSQETFDLVIYCPTILSLWPRHN